MDFQNPPKFHKPISIKTGARELAPPSDYSEHIIGSAG